MPKTQELKDSPRTIESPVPKAQRFVENHRISRTNHQQWTHQQIINKSSTNHQQIIKSQAMKSIHSSLVGKNQKMVLRLCSSLGNHRGWAVEHGHPTVMGQNPGTPTVPVWIADDGMWVSNHGRNGFWPIPTISLESTGVVYVQKSRLTHPLRPQDCSGRSFDYWKFATLCSIIGFINDLVIS